MPPSVLAAVITIEDFHVSTSSGTSTVKIRIKIPLFAPSPDGLIRRRVTAKIGSKMYSASQNSLSLAYLRVPNLIFKLQSQIQLSGEECVAYFMNV